MGYWGLLAQKHTRKDLEAVLVAFHEVGWWLKRQPYTPKEDT